MTVCLVNLVFTLGSLNVQCHSVPLGAPNRDAHLGQDSPLGEPVMLSGRTECLNKKYVFGNTK